MTNFMDDARVDAALEELKAALDQAIAAGGG